MTRALPLLLLLLLPSAALAQGEVEVLRARRALSYLSSNGNGASIYRAEATVDLAVKDLAYAKEVGVRFSTDDWRTSAEARAHWVARLADGREHWRAVVDLGTVGRNVRLGQERGDMGPAFVRFEAFQRTLGQTYRDDGGQAAAVLAPLAQPLPQARTAARTALVDGTLYLVGGQQRETYRFTLPEVLRLDAATGEWTTVAALPRVPGPSGGTSPELLVGYEVAAVGRRLHVLGGTHLRVGGHSTADLILDLDGGAWSTGSPLPGPLHDRRAVVVGHDLHLVPTTSARPAGDTAHAYVLDGATGAWRREAVAGLSLLAGARFVTAAHDGRLLLFGGAARRDVLVYDGRTRTIARAGSCPTDLTGAEPAVVLGGQVLLANVDVDLGRGDAAALLYDPVAGDFTRLPRRPLLPFEATLAAAPPALVAGPGGHPVARLHAALVLTGTSRVDTWLPEAGVLARGESRTLLRVQRDTGWGHRVTVRGAGGPLSWWQGREARWTPGHVWVFETTDLLEDVLVWKPLVDDARWLPGADLRVRRGETLTVTFP